MQPGRQEAFFQVRMIWLIKYHDAGGVRMLRSENLSRRVKSL